MTTENENRLMADAAKLEKSIAPSRDLWPDIEAAIAAPRETRRTPRFAQAAAVALLVGASSLVTYTLTKPGTSVSPVATLSELTFRPASFGGEYQLSTEYKQARYDLRARLDSELERLSPEARTDVEQNLKVIENAIAEINAALEREPDNALLQELLIRTYRDELAVMQKVGGLTQSVMSRNDI